ncbi:MAG: hypothetical protein Q9213_006048 [Squamulea squamosa]
MRASGLSYHKSVDAAWETFWQYISASIGLTMTSVAAFRSLFISQCVSNKQQEISDVEYLRQLYEKFKRALRQTFGIRPWNTRAWSSQDDKAIESTNGNRFLHLGHIERGTITGLRTFIHQYQRTPATASQAMYSQPGKDIDDYKEWVSPDEICVRGFNANHPHTGRVGVSGTRRPERIFAHKESQRQYKILAHRESRKQDKMLDSLES